MSPAIIAEEPALIACRLAKAPTPWLMASVSPARHHDVGDRAAEPVGDDLRQRRVGALPLGGGAGRDRDLAVAQDAHGDAFNGPSPVPST